MYMTYSMSKVATLLSAKQMINYKATLNARQRLKKKDRNYRIK